jgi:aryl-alcohol dehydrogenase-like predicted oxidoreductase
MFGGWGNPDHDDSIRITHRALDKAIIFIDTSGVYSSGGPGEIVGRRVAESARTMTRLGA